MNEAGASLLIQGRVSSWEDYKIRSFGYGCGSRVSLAKLRRQRHNPGANFKI